MGIVSMAALWPRVSALVAMLGLACPSSAQDRSAWQLDVATPQVLGYTIGDVIRHRARLVLDQPYRLDEDALPRARRLSSWLELRQVDVDVDSSRGSTVYEFELTYQIFNTAQTVSGISTPPVALTVLDGDSTFPIIIPAWGFTVSPITAPEEVPLGSLPVLRPSQSPPPVSLRAYQLRIAGLSVALIAALGYLGYLNGSIALIRRTNGPFARALRQLKKLSRRETGQAIQYEAYRCLHAAFDETAGRVIFADNLESFLAGNPAFRPLRAPIEGFYGESRRLFFAVDPTEPHECARFDSLLQLAGRCRDAERGIA